jgi:hypothetical protein
VPSSFSDIPRPCRFQQLHQLNLGAADATNIVAKSHTSSTHAFSAVTTSRENRRSAETDELNTAKRLQSRVLPSRRGDGRGVPTENQDVRARNITKSTALAPIIPVVRLCRLGRPVHLASHGPLLGQRDGEALSFSTGIRSLGLSLSRKRFCRSYLRSQSSPVQSSPFSCSAALSIHAAFRFFATASPGLAPHRRPRCFHSLLFLCRSFSASPQPSPLPSHGLSLALQQAPLPMLAKS